MPIKITSTDDEPGKEAQKGAQSHIQVDEWGLTGLSALLTFSPSDPGIEFGERRTGRDRRMANRRITIEAAPE